MVTGIQQGEKGRTSLDGLMIPLHSLHAVALRGTRSTTGAKISAENRTLLLDVPGSLPPL